MGVCGGGAVRKSVAPSSNGGYGEGGRNVVRQYFDGLAAVSQHLGLAGSFVGCSNVLFSFSVLLNRMYSFPVLWGQGRVKR